MDFTVLKQRRHTGYSYECRNMSNYGTPRGRFDAVLSSVGTSGKYLAPVNSLVSMASILEAFTLKGLDV